MSYSFSVKAPTKAEAKAKVAEQFAAVVAGQPTHAADQNAAVACAEAFINTLADPNEGDEVHVSMNGSLSWSNVDEYTGASVTVYASLRNTA